MRVTRLSAKNFLSLRDVDLDLGSGITVVAGPNSVGKTNLVRLLDLVSAVADWRRFATAASPATLYENAGYDGSPTFEVSLDLEFDQVWERDLIADYVRAAVVSQPQQQVLDAQVGPFVATNLIPSSLEPLWSGRLTVHFDRRRHSRWTAGWEFQSGANVWHTYLVGDGGCVLRPGPFQPSAPRSTVMHALAVQLFKTADEPVVVIRDEQTVLENPLDFRNPLTIAEPMDFQVHAPNSTSGNISDSLLALAEATGTVGDQGRFYEFRDVLGVILQRSFILTDNRRIPPRRLFTNPELSGPLDLRNGADIGGELYRLKNGSVSERRRYQTIEQTFTELTGKVFGLTAQPRAAGGDGTLIGLTIEESGGERPLEFCGAGLQEALVAATLLPDVPGKLFVLDEPAVNLETTIQRRLLRRLRSTQGQCLVITHSPEMIPVTRADDLQNMVRLAPGSQGPSVRRLPGAAVAEWTRWIKLLEPVHVRDLLFAAKVILCEGATEAVALPTWLRDTTSVGLPDPEAANIAFVDVGGDAGFGAYVEYLDRFAVPWAIVCDGPAMKPGSNLYKQLRRLGHLTDEQPGESADFNAWRSYWQRRGVFTVAGEFGDDGSKAGEFETLFARIDANLLAEARVQTSGKPRIGVYFAASCPVPNEVLKLYRDIMMHFDSVQ